MHFFFSFAYIPDCINVFAWLQNELFYTDIVRLSVNDAVSYELEGGSQSSISKFH